jgi:hypothetical protein
LVLRALLGARAMFVCQDSALSAGTNGVTVDFRCRRVGVGPIFTWSGPETEMDSEEDRRSGIWPGTGAISLAMPTETNRITSLPMGIHRGTTHLHEIERLSGIM